MNLSYSRLIFYKEWSLPLLSELAHVVGVYFTAVKSTKTSPVMLRKRLNTLVVISKSIALFICSRNLWFQMLFLQLMQENLFHSVSLGFDTKLPMSKTWVCSLHCFGHIMVLSHTTNGGAADKNLSQMNN